MSRHGHADSRSHAVVCQAQNETFKGIEQLSSNSGYFVIGHSFLNAFAIYVSSSLCVCFIYVFLHNATLLLILLFVVLKS